MKIFEWVFIEICFLGSNWRYVSIGSDNGLAPSRRQAIIWTNVDPVHWRIYAALGGDELINSARPTDKYISPQTMSSLVQVMVCVLFSAKLNFNLFWLVVYWVPVIKIQLSCKRMSLKMLYAKWRPFCLPQCVKVTSQFYIAFVPHVNKEWRCYGC